MLCNCQVPLKLKRHFDEVAIRLDFLGAECYCKNKCGQDAYAKWMWINKKGER